MMRGLDRLTRSAASIVVCAAMILGTAVLGIGHASAQVDDAMFNGTVRIGGTPAPNTLIMYSVDSQDSPAGNSTVTDGSGQYEIRVEGGHTYFLYFANGGAMFDATATVERVIAPGETLTVDVDLAAAPAPRVTIMGVVTNASNPAEPVTGGHLLGMRFVSGDNPDYINWSLLGGTGYFELQVLAGSVIAAVFDAPGYYPGMSGSPVLLNPGESAWLNFSLMPYGSENVNLTGTVTDVITTLGIPSALVEASTEGMGFWNSAYTDPSGAYNMAVLEGDGEIQVSAAGYVSQREYDIWFSGNMTFDFALYAVNADIHGYVLDASTLAPIEDAEVYAGTGIGGNRDMFSNTRSGTDGNYTLDICDGGWWVGAYARGYGESGTSVSVGVGESLYLEILLEPESSVVKGYVTDGTTGSPIAGTMVGLEREYGDTNGSAANSSGYYEIHCAPGDYRLFFSATGYAMEMQMDYTLSIGPNETVWKNQTLDAATTELYGDVLDAVTLAPLDGVDIGTGSVSPDDPDFLRIAMVSSAGGTYSAMIAPTVDSSQILSAELTGYESYFAYFDVPSVPMFEYDIYMIPEGGTSDLYTLCGYLNDSVTDMPIPWGQLNAGPDLNITWTNETGYYEMEVPCMVFQLQASATGYLPEVRTVMLQPPGVRAWENFSLVSHTTPPVVEMTVVPPENVSTANPADIYALITDEYLYFVSLQLSTVINRTADYAWIEEIEYHVFMPSLPWGGDLRGNQVTPDVWEVGRWNWPASNDRMLVIGDALGTEFYTGQYWTDWDDTIHVWGEYTNASLMWSVGAEAVFRADGTLIGIDVGLGPDPQVAADPTGTFWRTSSLGKLNLTTLQIDEWSYEARHVLETTSMYLTRPAVYPSGAYVALFWAYDKAWMGTANMTMLTVDNDPPVADSGPGQTAIEGTLVELNASGSSDNVGIAAYMWEFDDGGPVVRYGEVVSYSFTTAGNHTVTLTVTDGAALSDSSTTWVNVLSDNPPVAVAGSDQTVDEGELVTFNGSLSSDDIAVLNWTWTFTDGTPRTLYGEVVTHTFNTPGVYVVTLVVKDTAGQSSAPDTVSITVRDLTAPVADAGPDQDVVAGDTVTLDGSGSTDNVGIVGWTWTFTDGTTQTLSGETATYDFDNEDTFVVTLTVEDAAGNSDTDTVTIRVSPGNERPSADAGEDATIEEGDAYQFDGTGSTDDGGAANLNYTWTFTYDGSQRTLYGAEPEWTFGIAGEYNVTLTVRDEGGLTDVDWVTITVEEKAGVSIMVLAAIGAVIALIVIIAALVLMRRGKAKGAPPPPKEELEEPGPPEDEEL